MSSKVINTAAILILVVLSFAILANSMTKLLGRDEQMYCTGGVLLAQGKMIYQDFSYPSQLPYHPLLYAALFNLLNTTHYLLVGRIVSVLCDIFTMALIVVIYRHIFESYRISGALLGLAGAVLYVFNPLVDYANGYAWNHDVVILCVVLAFWFFISTDFQQRTKYWRIAAIGALLTFATCMRVTTALVQLLFFAVVLSQPADSIKERVETALPFLIATVIVLLWPIWVIAQAPRAFFLNLYWIPKLYGKWLYEIGMVHNKTELILSSITRPGYLVLILMVVYLYLVITWQRRKLTASEPRKLLFAAQLSLAFFIIALIPPTIWRQYLAVPVPFLIISFAYPLLFLRSIANEVSRNRHFKIASTLVVICLIIAVLSNPVVMYRTPMLLVPESWVPISLHNISEEIGQKTRKPKLVLTLAPLFALEGGCDIYTELSAGAIVYRVADRLSSSNRDITHTVGPRTLKKLIKESPPLAVILGVEMDFLEEPLFQAAIQPDEKNWERKVYESGPIVYFRLFQYPPCPTAKAPGD
ncbi:MAG: hypothetical protein ACE5NM_03410 [Sedimentisphaerales bacterium]